ncbi:MAG: 50S ribosomal protein L11 methyltransferase [Sandaracinaceae bacterium]|nr:50S ribosomal protein L11 methyltransferase [Sandaracinaceae bacterium]
MSEPRYPTVHVDVGAIEAPVVAELLFELGASGVEHRDRNTLDKAEGGDITLVAHFADETEAEEIATTLSARWPARVVSIEGDAWRDEWKRFFKPVAIGKRLVVRPSWEPFEPKRGQVVLTLDPGQAFGTGTHESTRLVLAEVERLVRGGERVLDVGCGSGILGIAALLLGAERVHAIDIDPAAIQVTRENARLNRVASRLRASGTWMSRVRGQFDLVLANIRAPILAPNANVLAKLIAPGGSLVLSGLLVAEEDEIREAYRGLALARRRVDGDWLGLTYRKRK